MQFPPKRVERCGSIVSEIRDTSAQLALCQCWLGEEIGVGAHYS